MGTLQWLAIKTRPDIAAITSILASLIVRCPSEVVRVTGGVWKYLASTWNVTLTYHVRWEGQIGFSQLSRPMEPLRAVTMTDASFAPGGDKSRSGYCIYLGGHLVHWGSAKQQLTALNSCEAEFEAAVVGVKQSGGVIDAVKDIHIGWRLRWSCR